MTALEREYFNDAVKEFNLMTEQLCCICRILQFDTDTSIVHNRSANTEQFEAAFRDLLICRNKMAHAITMMPEVYMELKRQEQ